MRKIQRGTAKKKAEMKGEIVELIKGLNKIINPINPTKNLKYSLHTCIVWDNEQKTW